MMDEIIRRNSVQEEPFSDTMFSYRKEVYWKFLVQSIKDILEEIVPPERTADIGYDLDERGENWNDCRNEIKKQIEIILK